MNKFLLAILAFVIIAILALVTGDREPPYANRAIQSCPDEKIINKMPGPGSGDSSYYIKDGVRKEIIHYDAAWVAANCNVPVQEVY